MPLTLSLNVVLLEVAFIAVTVRPRESAGTLLHPLRVISFELRSIGPSLDSLAVLRVVLPEATVQRPVLVEVVSKSVGFVVLPFSLVNVSIFVEEAAEEVGSVFFPVAFIEATVGPHLDALAFAYEFSFPPLANVAGSV